MPKNMIFLMPLTYHDGTLGRPHNVKEYVPPALKEQQQQSGYSYKQAQRAIAKKKSVIQYVNGKG